MLKDGESQAFLIYHSPGPTNIFELEAFLLLVSKWKQVRRPLELDLCRDERLKVWDSRHDLGIVA